MKTMIKINATTNKRQMLTFVRIADQYAKSRSFIFF